MVGDTVRAPREAVQNAQLVLTELLANEIKHGRHAAGDPLVCTVKHHHSALRIEVRHAGPAFEIPDASSALPLANRETGWGLALISRLADRWGVREVRGARQVWAEIDLSERAPRPVHS
jgi:anti-sigma regulatory factor (Ser/Thr protein kinase)